MVARMAESLGLRHAILTWTQGASQSGGLQERAREARYDLMAAYCHAHDIPALVTAHHLDDQAETFLMRLKRGSGLDGLAAIPEESVWSGIAVLRPLLDMPKARLAATLVAAGLGWAEDPSNRDQRFERARMRADGEALAKLGLTAEGARSLGAAAPARTGGARRCRANISRHPWRHERSRLLPDRARRAHRRAGRDRASRAGAVRQCRERQREPASACEARIASRRLKRKSEGRPYARRLPPPAARRTPWRVPRDERNRTAFAPACSRGTRAVGQPLRRRTSK